MEKELYLLLIKMKTQGIKTNPKNKNKLFVV